MIELGSLKRRISSRLLITIFGMVMLAWGSYAILLRYAATHGTAPLQEVNPPHIVTSSTDTPSEKKVDITAPYAVAANHPKIIHIPKIGVEGFVQRVGIDQHDNIAVPTNINIAGWYTNSVIPGDKGLSIIDGHVQGVYSPGIFKRLGELNKDDTFTIEFGDGHTVGFIVTSTKELSAKEAGLAMFRQVSDKQLNLITCSGKFNAKNKAYENRLLVAAKPL
jgi:LPXTG-site transpeptidase (sortase) family protein